MKVASYILAPLLALALLISQTAFFVEAMAPAKAPHCSCHKTLCCCQTPADPQSTPRPATPARTVTQNDMRIVAAVVEYISSTAAPALLSVPRFQASIEAGPVPLYRRDCALLI